MTRRSFQRGYVSEPFRTNKGLAFKIRYRIRGADGQWKQRAETLYGLPGKKAARAALQQRIKRASASLPETTELTLQAFIKAYWEPHLERKRVKPSTLSGYHSILENHLLPVLGDLRLEDIVPLHIEELLQRKETEKLSSRTVRNILGVLQSIFSLAEDNELIPRSPVRKSHKPEIQKQEKPIWSPRQVRSIIENVPLNFRSLFVAIALTGLRLGELLGLEWRHLDSSTRSLRIQQSLWRGQVVTPKTAGSYRTIPFGGALDSTLEIHRAESVYSRPEDFVFCRRDGSPLDPDVLRRDVLYPALDRLGIPRPSRAAGFHTFRHSAASIINAQTGNLKLAQKFLGHSNLSTTANIYTHTTTEAEREAATVLEQAILENKKNLFPVVPRTGTGNNTLVN